MRIALVHYQFEAIHPFRDGNGRIGRVLIVLQLVDAGLLPTPLLYLSGFFERNKGAYNDLLLAVSQEAAWLEWIRFFLRGIVEQATEAVQKIEALLDLQRQFWEKVQSARSSVLLIKLVDELFAMPVTTVTRASALLKVTNRSGQMNIAKLVDLGILEEITGRARNRIYAAMDIVRLLQAD